MNLFNAFAVLRGRLTSGRLLRENQKTTHGEGYAEVGNDQQVTK